MNSLDDSPNARMFRACRMKNIKDLTQALADGAEVETVCVTPLANDEADGKRAMHIAADAGFTEGMELLWVHGADLHAPDEKRGNTPLHLAVLRHHVDAARFLLDLGADPDAPNALNKTVRKVAEFTDKDINDDRMLPLVESYREFPKIKDMNAIQKPDDLWRLDSIGKCLLDNPQNWQRFDEVAAHLAEAGDPITKAHLQQTNSSGKSWLQVGTEYGAFAKIVAALNATAQQVQGEELLDENGQPNAILQRAVRWQQVPALFTHENWHGSSVNKLQSFAQALPEKGREQVPNFHQLRSQLQRDARLELQTGMGR